LRGGGGNFGVVTSFDLRLHEVGPTVFAGLVFYRGEDATRVLEGFPSSATDELSMVINLTTAPPLPFLPAEVHGRPIVAVLGMWSGNPADGDAATRPYRSLAPVVTDLFGPMPYTAMQTMLDPLYPRGLRNYFRSAFFDAIDPAPLVEAFSRVPNEMSELHIHQMGGAMGRVPADATAFGNRERPFLLNVVARSAGADGYQDAVDWARAASRAVGPDAAAYVNFTGEGSAYPKDTYDRLVAVKDRYDPTNLFRLNQNIRPSGIR
jgi:FAD/FMN-containing dehydrogenase